MQLEHILGFFAFALGACIASFLNVVIWRVPRGESIVSPPSHCPKCGAAIRWYQNLPIVSWLALRGRCAGCHEPISPRYILVETLGGALFLAAFLRFAAPYIVQDAPSHWTFPPIVGFDLLVVWIWLSLMIVGSFIDYDLKLLPDFVTVGGMVLGAVYGGVNSLLQQEWFFLLHSLAGLGFGFGLLWLVRFFGGKAFKREAMGLGDVFLMGAVGAISGPAGVLFTLIASSIAGSAGGLTLLALSKRFRGGVREIPFGPYICLSHAVYLFFGPAIVAWYLKMMGFQ